MPAPFALSSRRFDAFALNNSASISARCARINSSAPRNFSTDLGLSGRERKTSKASRASRAHLLRTRVRGGSSRSSPSSAKALISPLSLVEVDDSVSPRAPSNECSGDAGAAGSTTTRGTNASRGALGVNLLRCSPVSTLAVTDFNRSRVLFHRLPPLESRSPDKFSRRSKSCGSHSRRALSSRSKSFVRFFRCPRMSSCFVLALCIESAAISGECFCFCRQTIYFRTSLTDNKLPTILAYGHERDCLTNSSQRDDVSDD